MATKCAGCLQIIKNREYLVCSKCSDKYDIDCANVSTQRFYNTMTPEHKKKWVCPSCYCKTPKMGNTNSAFVNSLLNNPQENSPAESYVTQRKSKNTNANNYSTSSEDLSNLENTIQNANSPNSKSHILDHPLTLRNINELLETTLKQNNKSIITEIRKIIQNEVEEAISTLRNEIKQQAESSKINQAEINKEIQHLDSKIKLLSLEYKKLQSETQKLQTEIHIPKIDPHRMYVEIPKTLVLHGLPENCWETEEETCERVIQAIYDILNVDLTGYIEELSRIGKRGEKRPLRIELISKRMTKYILNSGRYFKNSGLSISEYLDERALRERKALNEALKSARLKGHHAVIRNNKLLIDGKEQIPQECKIGVKNTENKETKNQSPHNNIENSHSDRSLNGSMHNFRE